MKGAPQVPSLGDGVCATGYYRTPTTLDLPVKTRSQSNSYLIYRSKHKEAAKMRQRNMAQMKEEIKTPEKELNEMETSNLSDAEFKTLYKDAQGT